MRMRPRVDANQQAIVAALRAVHGVSVFSLAGVADGCPDLLVGIAGLTYLVEVKDGDRIPSEQTLTDDQVRFIERWEGSPVVILRSAQLAADWVRRKVTGTPVPTAQRPPLTRVLVPV